MGPGRQRCGEIACNPAVSLHTQRKVGPDSPTGNDAVDGHGGSYAALMPAVVNVCIGRSPTNDVTTA